MGKRWWIGSFLIAAMCGVFFGGGVLAAEEMGTLSGKVTDKTTGQPLVRASVMLKGTPVGAITDEQGQYRLPRIALGSYTVVVRRIGYAVFTGKVYVEAGEGTLNVALSPAPIELSEVVATATRTEKPVEEIPANVTVISRSTLQNQSGLTVDDFIAAEPGVDVRRSSGMFTMSPDITLRGTSGNEPSRTLVMVDGVPINKTDTGEANWNRIKPEDIERIEIVRGPASAIYGASAMGGVINFITRRATDGVEGHVTLKGGNLGTYGSDLSVSAGRTLGSDQFLNLYLSGTYLKSDGYISEPEEERTEYTVKRFLDENSQTVKLTYRMGLHEIVATYQRYDDERGEGEKIQAPNGEFRDFDTDFFSLRYRGVIAAFLAARPDVLILDEPTNSLDPPTADRLLDLLSGLGLTVVLVEHDLERIARWADRVVEMEKGRVIGEGPPEVWFSRSTRKPRAFGLAEALSEQYGLQPPSPVPNSLLAWMDAHRGHFQPLSLRKLPPQRRRQHRALQEPFSRVPLRPPRLCGANPKSEIRHGFGREVLRFEHVDCGYPGKAPVLSEVGLSVRQGEIVALLGLNGTGKTTLLKHIGGLLKPRRGRILIEGEDIARRKPEELFGKVGLVFQNPDYQIFDTTVAAECGFCLRNQKVPEAEIAARVGRWLEVLGIGALAERNPLTLSYGEKRRLTLASVLVAGPELIALDEPTTALDEANIVHLREVLLALSRKHGKAFLIATHDLDFALDVADRIVILGEGRVRVDVPVGELSAQALTDAGFPLPLSAEAAMRAGLVERPLGCQKVLDAIRET